MDTRDTGSLTALPIEALDASCPDDFYLHHVRASRPAVLRGFARSWPAVELWDLPYLAENHGDCRVVVERSRRRTVPHDPLAYLQNRYYETERLDRVID